jgi:hypothetical protein
VKCASALAAMTVIVLGTPAIALASTAGSGPGAGQPAQVRLACPRPHGKLVPPKFVHLKPPGKGVHVRLACGFPKGCPPPVAVRVFCRPAKGCPPPVAVRVFCRPAKGCPPPVAVRLACRVANGVPKACPSAALKFDMASDSSTLTEVSGPVLAPPEQFQYDGQTYTIMTVNPGADSFTVFRDGVLFVNNGPAITGAIGYLACTTGPFGN